jgi:peptidoglycan-associated lipoprotein
VQGAMSDQLVTISFGEERPADLGVDEAAWAQNRRVELVYER